MRHREWSLAAAKPDMTPMIDCVFQLMIFFMLTLKFVQAEGDLNLYLPQGRGPDRDFGLDIKVRLIADAKGGLQSVQLGQRNLGNDDRVFDRLNAEILRAIGNVPGGPIAHETTVEIDPDRHLQYAYVMRAMTACAGRFDERSQQVVRYVDEIRFAPVRNAGN